VPKKPPKRPCGCLIFLSVSFARVSLCKTLGLSQPISLLRPHTCVYSGDYNNNNNNNDHHPSSSSSSSTAHDNSQSLASSVRSLLRPRRLSWSTPASINKPRRAPSVESWASVQLPSPPPPPADIAVALDPPAHIDSHQQHTQPRSRRGSLGEPSSWRWLKALKSSPSPSTSMSPHHQHTQSNGPLYTDIPPTLSSSHHSTRRRLPSLPSPSPSSSSTAPPVLLDRSNRSGDRKVKLRRLVCPRDLVGAFVAMAEPQTAQGIELCGLLLGSIVSPSSSSSPFLYTILIDCLIYA
jgi:hypothetical protein